MFTDNLETVRLSRLAGFRYRGDTLKGYKTLIHQEGESMSASS